MRGCALTLLGLITATFAWAAPAGAAIPTGNLLADQNPGAELGPSSPTGYDVFTPQGWSRPPSRAGYSLRATTVRYGAPDFPSIASGAAIGGGNTFFAGGPTGDPDRREALIASQEVALPASVQPDVDAGRVQATLSACLGGYANQDDYVTGVAAFLRSDGSEMLEQSRVTGPSAAARGNVTKLLPATGNTTPLFAGARRVLVYLIFTRSPNTANQYNDGYADNVSLRLSPAGGPSPGADCSSAAGTAPGGGGGGAGGGGSQGGGNPAGVGGTNTAAGIARAAKRLTFKGNSALVKLRCTHRDSACKGSLSLTTKFPKVRKSAASRLGSARFTIAAGKTKTVKVKLKRSTSRRIKKLSARRVRKLKIAATARIGAQSTKFTLGATRER